MSPSLRVLPGIDPKEQHEYSVHELEVLVKELKDACDGFKENLEQVRAALGMSRIDFERWRDQKFEGIANLQDKACLSGSRTPLIR
jgi:hypothetical protein